MPPTPPPPRTLSPSNQQWDVAKNKTSVVKTKYFHVNYLLLKCAWNSFQCIEDEKQIEISYVQRPIWAEGLSFVLYGHARKEKMNSLLFNRVSKVTWNFLFEADKSICRRQSFRIMQFLHKHRGKIHNFFFHLIFELKMPHRLLVTKESNFESVWILNWT